MSFLPTLIARRGRIPLAMVSTDTLTENPLLQQEALPKFSSIEPANLTPAVSELLTKMEQDFEALEQQLDNSDAPPDYNQVLPQVERIQFPLGYVWGVAGHLNGVKNGDELRAAYEENQPKVVQSMTKFSQSKALYHALEQLQGKLSMDGTFEEKQKARAVENSLLGMKLGGVGLEGEEKFQQCPRCDKGV